MYFVHIFNRQAKTAANQSTNVSQVTFFFFPRVTSPAARFGEPKDCSPNARRLSFFKATQLNCQLVFGGEGVEASGNFSCLNFFLPHQFFLQILKKWESKQKGGFANKNSVKTTPFFIHLRAVLVFFLGWTRIFANAKA